MVVSGEVGYQLDDRLVRGADIALHLGDVEVPDRGCMTTMPDIVVEIASPTDRYTELDGKVLQYLDAGVTEVWIVDPANRTVLQRRTETHRLVRGDAALESDQLPGFSASLDELFGPAQPGSSST